MLQRWIGFGLVTLFSTLVGCTVVVHGDPPPRRVVVVENPPPPPPPAPAATIVWEDEEVHTVVYREYFGASDAEIVLIPHYRRYYYWTDDDIYFLWFCSRRANVSFSVCCNTYYSSCGGDYNRLIVSYNIPHASFFVSVNAGASYPPVYARTYACYQTNNYNVTFTHEEFHALGKGGKTVTGAAVQASAPRPWTMPPGQRQQWQKEHQSQVAKSEVGFKDQHKDQVQKFQQKEKEKATAHSKEKEKDKDKDKDPKSNATNAGGKEEKPHSGAASGAPGEKEKPHTGAASGAKDAPGDRESGEKGVKTAGKDPAAKTDGKAPPAKAKEEHKGKEEKKGKEEEEKKK